MDLTSNGSRKMSLQCPICGWEGHMSLGAHYDHCHCWLPIEGPSSSPLMIRCHCGEVLEYPSDELDEHLFRNGKTCMLIGLLCGGSTTPS